MDILKKFMDFMAEDGLERSGMEKILFEPEPFIALGKTKFPFLRFTNGVSLEHNNQYYEYICDISEAGAKPSRNSTAALIRSSIVASSTSRDSAGYDPLIGEISFWIKIVESCDAGVVLLDVFPCSFQLILSFFHDLIDKVKGHLAEKLPKNISGASKRIKRIVRNLQLLFEIPYDPLFESVDSEEFREFSNRYNASSQVKSFLEFLLCNHPPFQNRSQLILQSKKNLKRKL
jgi:hypothetical protein